MIKFRRQLRAQTAMELAVFGAILIFVIGAIVRQALSAGSMQNEYLRAMRQAMSTSYRYSTGLISCRNVSPCPAPCNGECSATSNKSYPGPYPDGTASHQTASILFVEDRLTADSAKYGAIDRTPYMVSASASYSRNLFLPVDANENYNLPIYDVFINGKHFPFTVSAFKRVVLAKKCACAGASPCPAECGGDCADPCPAECAGGCPADSLQLYPGPDLPCVNKSPCPLQCGGDCDSLPASSWEPNCATVTRTLSQCVAADCIAACPDFVNNCTFSPGPPATDTQTVGCAKLYTVIYHHGSYLEWCTDEPGDPACPVWPNPAWNLTADERFDLDRNGITDVPGILGTARKDFSWQWYLVSGYDATVDRSPNVTLKYPDSGIILEPSTCTDACKQPRYTSVDVDGDLKLEQVMVDTKEVDETTGVIRSFIVMDSQDGDLDMSRGDSDPGPRPGLTKDVKMYARVQAGTYLLIEEGKLYALVKNPTCVAGCAGNAACIAACPGDANQYIRTTQKKDQIDLVERVIQLSNDTDRFCDSIGNVVTERLNNGPSNGPNPAPVIWTAGAPNPVEACNDCFSGANIQKTCMDEANKLIYVRSRVVDRRGRKWVTNTSSDAYVNFATPPGP